VKIFVYGTLKRGYWNNDLLADAEFVGEAMTVEEFQMRDIGFPLLIEPKSKRARDRGRVKGEIFNVNERTLATLDRLEGHPHNYCRLPLCVTRGKRATVVEAYVWQREPTGEIVEPVEGVLEWKRSPPHCVREIS
jgi:gamma-glutamylcyclotransferase (GGCT)/AIG2-like uncharacterized protein YtfP